MKVKGLCKDTGLSEEKYLKSDNRKMGGSIEDDSTDDEAMTKKVQEANRLRKWLRKVKVKQPDGQTKTSKPRMRKRERKRKEEESKRKGKVALDEATEKRLKRKWEEKIA